MTQMVRTLIFTLVAVLMGAAASPGIGQVKIDTQWVYDADGVQPGGAMHAAIEFKLSDHFHVQSDKPLDELLIPTVLSVTPPEGITVREIVYPEPVGFEVLGFDEPLLVFPETFTVGIAFDVGDEVEAGTYSITAKLQYQACDDKVCLAPTSLNLTSQVNVIALDVTATRVESPLFDGIEFSAAPGTVIDTAPPSTTDTPPTPTFDEDCDVLAELENFTVLGTAGGYLGVDDFLAFVDAAETGQAQRGMFEDMGPIAIVLLVIFGGVLLNLTPCVLPLIPINLAIIGAGAQAGSRARGFALGGTYGLAMAIVYGALGLIVTLTASTFGTINSTVWFNVGIAILFIVLALAMFDVIQIDFTKFQSKLDASKVGKQGTFVVAFFMGGVAALLAGACVAPVVIQVIVYSGDQYAKGSTIALALPFFLGLGMALPWPFAGAGLSLLPKPGMWMVRVKQAMGVFILAFAAYYAYVGWEIFDSTRVDGDAVASAVQEQLEGGWTASLCQGMAQAKAENKPVLIDMWATWCKNCLAMDKTTFKDASVTARLDDYVKVKFQAQKLEDSPNKEMLERFKGIGLPVYAILRLQSPEDPPADVVSN